jgi:hypothetical protein
MVRVEPTHEKVAQKSCEALKKPPGSTEASGSQLSARNSPVEQYHTFNAPDLSTMDLWDASSSSMMGRSSVVVYFILLRLHIRLYGIYHWKRLITHQYQYFICVRSSHHCLLRVFTCHIIEHMVETNPNNQTVLLRQVVSVVICFRVLRTYLLMSLLRDPSHLSKRPRRPGCRRHTRLAYRGY